MHKPKTGDLAGCASGNRRRSPPPKRRCRGLRTGSGMCTCKGYRLQAASVEVSPREFGKIGGVINVSDSV
jgi:hypothetical protein